MAQWGEISVNSKPQQLDTQVVSLALKGRWDRPVEGCCISSIVANELLLVQSQKLSQADLYIPLWSPRHFAGASVIASRRRDHPFNKRLSDSVIMDFGNEFPTIVEYNNQSIANAISEGLDDLFIASINHFHKPKRKLLASRFRFIVDNGIRCVPLQQEDVEYAFLLLAQFRRKHNLKHDFRNSWNDLLILSTAICRRALLVTEDNELTRFAVELCGASPSSTGGFLEIPFLQMEEQTQRSSRESKGYVNVRWRVSFCRVQKSRSNRQTI